MDRFWEKYAIKRQLANDAFEPMRCSTVDSQGTCR